MTRYQFLKSCGFSGGALFALLSCVREEDSIIEARIGNPDGETFINPDGSVTDVYGNTVGGGNPTTTGPDQSLIITTAALEALNALYRVDVTNPLYTRLLTRNNFLVLGNTFVVALSRTGVFIAATVVCSHEFNRSVRYQNGEWYCPQHGARFSLTGSGLNDYGKNGIKVYKTAFDGKTIVIYE